MKRLSHQQRDNWTTWRTNEPHISRHNGTQLRALLKPFGKILPRLPVLPLRIILLRCSRGFKGPLNSCPMMPRGGCLYVDRCRISNKTKWRQITGKVRQYHNNDILESPEFQTSILLPEQLVFCVELNFNKSSILLVAVILS